MADAKMEEDPTTEACENGDIKSEKEVAVDVKLEEKQTNEASENGDSKTEKEVAVDVKMEEKQTNEAAENGDSKTEKVTSKTEKEVTADVNLEEKQTNGTAENGDTKTEVAADVKLEEKGTNKASENGGAKNEKKDEADVNMEEKQNKGAAENGAIKAKEVVATDLEKKIIRQVEHYFGDYNLPRDKFLQEAVKVDDGWVDMETMLKFKRLSQLSTDSDVILSALKKSLAGMMEISGEGKEAKVRRSPALPVPDNTEESKRDVEARTVYVKGFDRVNTTLDELIDYFHNSYENVLNVNMRNWSDKKTKERNFKGSVFVTFKNEESAKKLMESKDVKYKDEPLIVKFQKDYFEEKAKELAEKKKERQQDKDKVQKAKGNAKEEKKEEPKFTLPKGATLVLKGMGEEITREDIKEKLQQDFGVNIDKDGGEIAFITYNKGDVEAMVRFKEEDAAKPIAEKWNGMEKVEIKETAIACFLMTGENEEKYLAGACQDLKDRRNKNRQGQKRRGGYQGSHGGKRGRRH